MKGRCRNKCSTRYSSEFKIGSSTRALEGITYLTIIIRNRCLVIGSSIPDQDYYKS